MSMVGIAADNDWIINASYIDKTFMRHKLSFDLFREMNDNNIAPQSGYAEVFENGKYEGLYVVMERLDATRLKLDKQDPEAFVFKEPPLLSEDVGFRDRDSMFRESQKFPNIRKGERSQSLKKLEALILRGDDQTFRNEIFDHLDIDNLIDWQLLLLFSNNTDGQHKNYFIYRQRENEPMRIALWDCDHAFGRDGDNELNMFERMIGAERMLLFRRLAETNPNGVQEKMCSRWHELRQHVFTVENIFNMMDKMHQQIEPAITKNAKRWPMESKWYFDDNDYQAEVAIMKEFITKRLVQLDQKFADDL